jgi:simple sugar transport system ATP-binding protein
MNAAPPAPVPALELRGIDKRFGPVHANRAVSFAVRAGTVHGLIGENGAGKSTLMNIVYGLQPPDAGAIFVHGREVRLRHPHEALAAGIGMVHQHFMLVDTFTVLENLLLGDPDAQHVATGRAAAREKWARLAGEQGLEVPLDAVVGELPVGVQQRVEILKALGRKAEILILDEPTAVLTPAEATQLFHLLARLRAQGKTVLLVTHKLREIMAVTDRVTVMRQGAVVAELDTARTSPPELAEKMVGRSVLLRVEKVPSRPGKVLLEAAQLAVADDRGVPRVKGVSFQVRAGEIVGIAGVAGNGQSALLEALAGIRAPTAGTIRIAGQADPGADPAQRRRLGLSHVPEDRLRIGVVTAFAAEDNLILGQQERPEFSRRGLLDRRALTENCRRAMAEYDLRPPDPRLRLGAFSGGNQQKLVLAREIEAGPRVLLVGQPTRGVDIGAIEFIHRRLVALRDAGKAVLLVSVELDEILGLADRILVMAGGEIMGELPRAEATEEKLGLLMAGVRTEGGA